MRSWCLTSKVSLLPIWHALLHSLVFFRLQSLSTVQEDMKNKQLVVLVVLQSTNGNEAHQGLRASYVVLLYHYVDTLLMILSSQVARSLNSIYTSDT
jgi:hypothetical protein